MTLINPFHESKEILMKKRPSITLLTFLTILFFSCNKNESHYFLAKDEVAPRLESTIFPVVTKPTEMVIGNEQSLCSVGETITLFLPYQVVADDIQHATISLKDESTGDVVREMEMVSSTDLSILNVTVPEEIQGSGFMFITIPIESDLSGKRIGVSTKITAYKQFSEDAMHNAFLVQ